MNANSKGKYVFLFEDVNVKRWYDNVARGSHVTADVYLRRLGSFCELFSKTPEILILLSEADLHNLMLDYVSLMEQKEYAGGYIESTLKAVKSWLSHNGKEIKRKIKIKGARDTPSLKNERVPTRDELRKIFLSGDKKARVASILVAHAGLRLETLGNYTGDNGLKIEDFPELKVDPIEFEKVPTLVVVRKELSKAGHQYFTFLSEEGCEYVKDYLQERIRQGEEITLDTSVISPKLRMKSFIRAINIGDTIREAIRRAGFPWRPYVLRSYFDTQLMLSESKGLILRDYRQFFMGHKGDIEARYTTNKCKLSEDVIEDLREAYARSQEYLQTAKPETSEEKLKEAFRKQLLLVAGFSQDEIGKMDFTTMSDEEFQKAIKQRLLGDRTADCERQKVITLNEIQSHLSEGWLFVSTLPNQKVIVKKET